jgi:hypothetical protein
MKDKYKKKNKDKDKGNIISFPSSVSKLERQVEAVLFSAAEPLDVETIEKRVQTNTNLSKIEAFTLYVLGINGLLEPLKICQS